jgi:diaminohydroxyphosphoribosylaminopyrimidine deaminase/5-amino-6-(5-phosphoribosylamino)uracil reductase
LFDDPSLTTRLWKGANPVRLVVDMNLRLPLSLQLFNKKVKTIVFNSLRHEEQDNLLYYQVTQDVSLVHQLVNALYQLKIQSVLVEGGARLLQSFIDEGLWDEIRLITNNEQVVTNGLSAPRMQTGRLHKQEQLFSDTLQYFVNPQTLVL